jgi:LPXTG-site transpeptidase (sortase) family protein
MLGDFWLEIPKLGVQIPIVGVPPNKTGWDITWLGDRAGWLQGSAYPTWAGNSVITGHVWNADNTSGPFLKLTSLNWGDQVIIHAWGQSYIYEVRTVSKIYPDDVASMMKHEDFPWLTLVTCQDFDAIKNEYRYRIEVKAVQVAIK